MPLRPDSAFLHPWDSFQDSLGISSSKILLRFSGDFFNIFGILLGFFWDSFGILLGFFWDSFGILLGFFLGFF